jgi:hypothetical protein
MDRLTTKASTNSQCIFNRKVESSMRTVDSKGIDNERLMEAVRVLLKAHDMGTENQHVWDELRTASGL